MTSLTGWCREGAALADYGVAIAGADGNRRINLQATEQERSRRKAAERKSA